MSTLIQALLQPAAYDHPVDAVQLIETHISWILLTGPYAYKLRKPVNLGFVDFSSPERRRWFSQEELRLNRRLAPELYLDLRPVHGPADQASLHGSGAVIDTAVRMRQFPQSQLLPAVLERGELTPALLEQLAEELARFHRTAAIAPASSGFGSAAAVAAPALANLEVLARLAPGEAAELGLEAWTRSTATGLADRFQQRLLAGAVREGHGDLHLGNMVLIQGRITVFDCLEFSEALRWIDVISDLAFLVMDLRQRGRCDLAGVVLDRWLQDSGDYQGLHTWRWYLVYRALVRAKVAALRLQQPATPDAAQACRQELRRYLQVAAASSSAGRGELLICHGVSGSGKSHLARRLCRQLGWIRLCSDIERRRLFGRWSRLLPAEPLDGDPYAAAVTERLYGQELLQAAEAVLAGGESLIVDATFLRRSDRQRFQQLAQRCGARFRILDCRIDLDQASARVAARRQAGGDPSEADERVLRQQWQQREPLTPREQAQALTLDRGIDLDNQRWLALLEALQTSP